MPLPLLAILGGLAFAAVVVLVYLNWDRIIGWFRGRQSLKQADRDNIAFTVKENLSDGNYSVVQGIFNQRTNQVLDGEKYNAKDLCDELKYNKESLIIYN